MQEQGTRYEQQLAASYDEAAARDPRAPAPGALIVGWDAIAGQLRDATRLDELRELLLSICPMQQWIVLLVDPVEPLELAGEGFGSGAMGTAELGS